MTIITQIGNVAFFKDLAARKHTIVPDDLGKDLTAEPIKIKLVDDELPPVWGKMITSNLKDLPESLRERSKA